MSLKLLCCYKYIVSSLFLCCVMSSGYDNAALNSSVKCKVHNWKNMTCYWDRYFVDGQEVPMVLKYKKRWDGSKYEDCYMNSSDELHSMCHFVSTRDSRSFFLVPYDIILKSSNQSLVSDSSLCLDDLYDIVQPGPVLSMKITELTSSSVRLIWSPPYRKNFTYTVSYSSNWNHSKSELNTTEPSIWLSGLIPHSTYKVGVKCICRKGSRIRGFWSDAMEFEFVTKEDVPGAAPKIFPGSFMYVNESTIMIAWQPIPRILQNGIVILSRIRTERFPSEISKYNVPQDRKVSLLIHHDINGFINSSSTSTSHIINTSLCEAFVHLDSEDDFVVFLDQGTSVGFNDSLELKSIIIPVNKRALPNINIANATVNKEEVIKILWQDSLGASSHTIYWCWAYDHTKCINSFETEVVASDVFGFTKHFPFGGKGRLVLARSTEYLIDGHIISSGMDIIPCIFNTSKALIRPPQNFHLLSHGSDGISLKWDPPDCFSEYPPYFNHYVISYCSLPGCGDVEKEFVPSDKNEVTIRGISPGNTFRFAIQMVNGGRLSPHSSHIEVKLSTTFPDMLWFVLPVSVLVVGISLLVLIIIIFIFKRHHEPLKIDIPESHQDFAGFKELVFYND